MRVRVDKTRDERRIGKVEDLAVDSRRDPLDRRALAECRDASVANEDRAAFDEPKIVEGYPLLRCIGIAGY